MIDPKQNVPWQFVRIVESHGDRLAIVGGNWAPTYRELDEVSNHLAAEILTRLDGRGESPGDDPFVAERIALLMAHDSALLMSMLAVLKAGRTYLVINPNEPAARIETLLADAEPLLVITDLERVALAERLAPRTARLVITSEALRSGVSSVPLSSARPKDVACLIHTSGSTGRPKGVMRTHGQIIDCARRVGSSFPDDGAERVIALASFSTGQGQTTVWTTLLRGGTLYPFAAAEHGVVGLIDFINRHEVNVIISSVSLFRCLLGTLGTHRLEGVRAVRLASEPANSADCRAFERHFSSSCRLINALSASETGVIADWQYIPDDPVSVEQFRRHVTLDHDRLPIGRPIEGIDLSLVDENGNEVADGEPGEIVVQSPFFAAGYWKSPELTARHFSFDSSTGTIRFQSGDRAIRHEDGTLTFAGRKDARLKIRGFRIEPADVERAIQSEEGIESAVVGAMTGPAAEPLLIAYFQANSWFDGDIRSLRTRLRDRLPDYMIPARFIQLDSIPLTVGGKVHRQHLFSQPLPDVENDSGHNEPQNELERMLASIWQKVFQRERVGRLDHFFELGGDSLLAAVVAAHVHAAIKIELPLRSFSDHPTLAELAEDLAHRKASSSSDADDRLPMRPPRSGPLPLSFAQEWVYLESTVHSQPETWTTVQRHQLIGEVCLNVWEECFRQLFDRHEIFRTTFGLCGDRPSATVHDRAVPSWSIVDLRQESDPRAAADALVLSFLRTCPFVLQRLPLVRFWLVRTGDNEYLLYRAIHHIIVDAWSWRIFFNELAQLYQALLQGKDDPLPDAPQYVDYAAQQRAVMDVDSPRFQKSVEWWRKCFHRRLSPLRLPLLRRRAEPSVTPQDGVREFALPRTLSARLHQLGVREGTSHFSIRFAVLAAALAELAGRRDFVVGTYTTGRTRLDFQNTFGMFANLVTVRLRWDPSLSFVEWLRSVNDWISDARENGEIPYEVLCEVLLRQRCRRPAIHAIICTTDRFSPREFGGLEISSPQRLVESIPWGFSLSVVLDAGDAWRCEFDARRYDPKLVDVFLDWTQELFDVLSSKPDEPLADLLRDERKDLRRRLRSCRGRSLLFSTGPVADGISRLAESLIRRWAA